VRADEVTLRPGNWPFTMKGILLTGTTIVTRSGWCPDGLTLAP
jgi:hypothetical protein